MPSETSPTSGKVKDIVPGTILQIILAPAVGSKPAKVRTVLVEEVIVEQTSDAVIRLCVQDVPEEKKAAAAAAAAPAAAQAVPSFEITVDLLQDRVLEIDGARANYEYAHKEVAQEVKVEESTGPETPVWMIKRHGEQNVWTQLPDTINENVEDGYKKFQTAVPSRSGRST